MVAVQYRTLSKIPDPHERPTLSVPEAGALAYGVGPDQSYRLARAGVIPTRRIGARRVVVVTAELRESLGVA